MKLCTQTHFLSNRYGLEEAIRRLSAAGFDSLDLSLFGESPVDGDLLADDRWISLLDKITNVTKECGIGFTQAHAPFPSWLADQDDYNRQVFPRILRSIEMAGALGADCIVVHPFATPDPQRMDEANFAFFRSLLPTARQAGVRVALENMWGRDPVSKRIVPNVCSTAATFNRYLDELNDPMFTACLDLGHCGLVGEDAARMTLGMGGKRVQALHVHDNDHLQDRHVAPFWGLMEWTSITRALADIEYTGQMTLESDNFFLYFQEEAYPAATQHLVRTGRRLIEMVQAAR